MLKEFKSDLQKLGDREKAKFLAGFFKTGKGQYAEGDKMLGISVPDQRKVAKKYKDLDLGSLQILLNDKIHEYRLTALFILVDQYEKSKDIKKKEIFDFFIKNTKNVNNWDLVDSSAPKIVGAYLLDKERVILYKLAVSENLWERRIAMLACYAFIRNEDFDDGLAIADVLVDDNHDLIHKAVGWMLREIGNKNQKVEESFLKKHYKTMPRTMLRYAIEKFDKKKKDFYMGR